MAMPRRNNLKEDSGKSRNMSFSTQNLYEWIDRRLVRISAYNWRCTWNLRTTIRRARSPPPATDTTSHRAY
jgi:hypothetical protein